ncbi:amidohydrolase family protein [Arthrobacter sp. SA17]
MVFALVGPRSIALITDAMAAAGMADGAYTLGSLDVTVRDGIARLDPSGGDAVPGAIAGGTSRLLGNVRRCVEWGIPLTDAVTAASFTPARLINLQHVGALLKGYRADLIVANDELEMLQVYRAGAQVRGGQFNQEGTDRADSAV